MSAPQTQAIVVREVHGKREQRDTNYIGVGQAPDETYGQIGALLIQILGYFDAIVQQNPQDLTAPRMANLTTQLQALIQQYNSEVEAELSACQSAAAQTSTQLQQTQQAASSGVTPQAAAGIAIASALGGGALGFFVRARMR